MVITLIGFMGCGKSTVGELLGSELGWTFTDLDGYIAHKTGKSCAAVIDIYGEDHFRAVEADAFRDLMMLSALKGENTVIALGGGTPMTFGIQHLIFGKTVSVYLETTAQILKQRIAGGQQRRPLYNENTFEDLLKEREPVYSRAAMTVCTDGKTPQQVANEIINDINNGKYQH